MSVLNITPPAPVQRALELLGQAGFSAYIVGGCVRDALRGTEPHDWDCTTSAKPEDTARVFSAYHVIETGMQHGTVTAVIDGMPIEITTYRIDGSYADHRRPDSVTFTDRLTDDLARRDLSINAMAYHPVQGLIDPYGGAADLQSRTIRCVGRAEERFGEDGLRILRAMRFASVLDFNIAPETAAAIHEKQGLLEYISVERIAVELTKLLCGVGAERILTEFADVLFTVLPSLRPMYRFDQCNPHHDYDVYTHTLKVVSAVPPISALRWAALLHDTGKPHCFTQDERGGHFYGHGDISGKIAADVMEHLRFDRKTADRVVLLVKRHDTVWDGKARQIAKCVRRDGIEATEQLLLLHRGDVAGQAEIHRAERMAAADRMLDVLADLRAKDACMSLKKLAVTGSDLIALGFPQGKSIGITLNQLLDMVIDGTIPNDRDELLKIAKTLK